MQKSISNLLLCIEAMIFTGFNGQDALEEFVVAQDNCSFCGKPLAGCKIIVWKFTHADIWLHATCALSLADHLQRDAFQAIPKA